MSMKSDIYTAYVRKHEAANAALGGEPTCEHYLSPKRLAEIEALPRSASWGRLTGRQGYLLPDGRVIELRKEVCFISRYAVIYQNEAHHRGYYEIMGPGQYFEA
jgi:hypothetical protein